MEVLELKCVAGRIKQEERTLLAGLPFEPDTWLNDKVGPRTLEPICEFHPLSLGQHDTKVFDGNLFAINRVRGRLPTGVRRQMRDELMPIEIEIDPVI